jgi:hypothetical protein
LNDLVATIASLLRLAAAAAAILVALSLAAFAYDEVKAGSQASQASIGSDVRVSRDPSNINIPAPDRSIEGLREKDHSAAREFIDDANDILVGPFTGLISDSDSIWQQRLVTGLLGLLLYGCVMLLLANYMPKKKQKRISGVYEIPPDFRRH